jgi:hypothetical protein
MESKGHRENILSRKFEEIGVAILEIKKDNQKSYLIVQHFGAPLSKDDMEKKTICEKESRENCEEAEKNEEEIEDLIEKQEEIIDNARDEGLKEDDMEDVLDNLEKLKETEDEIEDYLDECEEFINDCDEWR